MDDFLDGFADGPLCHLDVPGLSCYEIETVYGGTDPTTVHACPRPEDDGMMPCCGVPPFERRADRITLDPALVTCRRRGWGVGTDDNEGDTR